MANILSSATINFSEAGLAELRSSLSGITQDFDTRIGEQSAELQSAMDSLSKHQQALQTNIDWWDRTRWNDQQLLNRSIGELREADEFQREQDRLLLERTIQGLESSFESQSLISQENVASLRDQFEKVQRGFQKGEETRALAEGFYKDKLGLLEDLFKLNKADLDRDRASARATLRSLGRSQALVRQQMEVAKGIEDRNLEVNQLLREELQAQRRDTMVSGRIASAQTNMLREFFGYGQGAAIGGPIEGQTQFEQAQRVRAIASQIAINSAKRRLIMLKAKNIRLGYKKELEGLNRQKIKARASVKKIDSALAKQNLNHALDKRIIKFNLDGIGIERKHAKIGLEAQRGITQRKVSHQLDMRKIMTESYNFGKKMSNQITLLKRNTAEAKLERTVGRSFHEYMVEMQNNHAKFNDAYLTNERDIKIANRASDRKKLKLKSLIKAKEKTLRERQDEIEAYEEALGGGSSVMYYNQNGSVFSETDKEFSEKNLSKLVSRGIEAEVQKSSEEYTNEILELRRKNVKDNLNRWYEKKKTDFAMRAQADPLNFNYAEETKAFETQVISELNPLIESLAPEDKNEVLYSFQSEMNALKLKALKETHKQEVKKAEDNFEDKLERFNAIDDVEELGNATEGVLQDIELAQSQQIITSAEATKLKEGVEERQEKLGLGALEVAADELHFKEGKDAALNSLDEVIKGKSFKKRSYDYQKKVYALYRKHKRMEGVSKDDSAGAISRQLKSLNKSYKTTEIGFFENEGASASELFNINDKRRQAIAELIPKEKDKFKKEELREELTLLNMREGIIRFGLTNTGKFGRAKPRQIVELLDKLSEEDEKLLDEKGNLTPLGIKALVQVREVKENWRGKDFEDLDKFSDNILKNQANKDPQMDVLKDQNILNIENDGMQRVAELGKSLGINKFLRTPQGAALANVLIKYEMTKHLGDKKGLLPKQAEVLRDSVLNVVQHARNVKGSAVEAFTNITEWIKKNFDMDDVLEHVLFDDKNPSKVNLSNLMSIAGQVNQGGATGRRLAVWIDAISGNASEGVRQNVVAGMNNLMPKVIEFLHKNPEYLGPYGNKDGVAAFITASVIGSLLDANKLNILTGLSNKELNFQDLASKNQEVNQVIEEVRNSRIKLSDQVWVNASSQNFGDEKERIVVNNPENIATNLDVNSSKRMNSYKSSFRMPDGKTGNYMIRDQGLLRKKYAVAKAFSSIKNWADARQFYENVRVVGKFIQERNPSSGEWKNIKKPNGEYLTWDLSRLSKKFQANISSKGELPFDVPWDKIKRHFAGRVGYRDVGGIATYVRDADDYNFQVKKDGVIYSVSVDNNYTFSIESDGLDTYADTNLSAEERKEVSDRIERGDLDSFEKDFDKGFWQSIKDLGSYESPYKFQSLSDIPSIVGKRDERDKALRSKSYQMKGPTAGKIKSVYDGDTITIEMPHPNKGTFDFSVRIKGIDAPERGTKEGDKLAVILRDMLVGADIEFKQEGRGYYGRALGEIMIDGEPLSEMLLGYGVVLEYAAPKGKDVSYDIEKKKSGLDRRPLGINLQGVGLTREFWGKDDYDELVEEFGSKESRQGFLEKDAEKYESSQNYRLRMKKNRTPEEEALVDLPIDKSKSFSPEMTTSKYVEKNYANKSFKEIKKVVKKMGGKELWQNPDIKDESFLRYRFPDNSTIEIVDRKKIREFQAEQQKLKKDHVERVEAEIVKEMEEGIMKENVKERLEELIDEYLDGGQKLSKREKKRRLEFVYNELLLVFKGKKRLKNRRDLIKKANPFFQHTIFSKDKQFSNFLEKQWKERNEE